VRKWTIRERVGSATRSVLRGIVKLGLGVFRPSSLLDPLAAAGIESLTEFSKVQVNVLELRLHATLQSCAEISLHSSHLVRPYRRKRQLLAKYAVTLAGGRLLSVCRNVLRNDRALEPRLFGYHARLLVKATSFGLCCRLSRLFLTFVPTDIGRSLDDATMRGVLLVLRRMQNTIVELDLIALHSKANRRCWVRLDVVGQTGAGEDPVAHSLATHEISWLAPTSVSRLIYLSTFRDNNTGTYYHPDLSRRFSPKTVNQTLGRIHKDTCEEMLIYPFADLVEELKIYADQTGSGPHKPLATWKSTRAYRTARSSDLDPFSSLCFELKLDFAVVALESRSF
jgi:hypothetical protein